MRVRLTHVLLTLVILAAAPTAFAGERAQQNDPRFFAETGYRIANDEFWKFFQGRGGMKTFGLPTSREMTFKGFTVQFFQRAVMQIGPNGVETLNLLIAVERATFGSCTRWIRSRASCAARTFISTTVRPLSP